MLSLSIPDASGTVVVHVMPRESGLRTRGPCKLPAPNAKATLNGVSLERRRGKSASDDFAYDRDCIVEFAMSGANLPRTGAGAVLHLFDESASWTFELPKAFSQRSFTLAAPSNGVLHRGERVVVKWSPADDQIDARGVGFELYRSEAELGNGNVFRDIDVRGDELSFTIPADTRQPWQGRGSLRFLGYDSVKPASKGCPVEECVANVSFVAPPIAVSMED